MTDQLEWYIYLHEWSISMVNVGKHTIQYMDPMGIPPFYELNGQGQLDLWSFNRISPQKKTQTNCLKNKQTIPNSRKHGFMAFQGSPLSFETWQICLQQQRTCLRSKLYRIHQYEFNPVNMHFPPYFGSAFQTCDISSIDFNRWYPQKPTKMT